MVTEPVLADKRRIRGCNTGMGPEMARMWVWSLVTSFALTCSVCQGQTAIPDRLPELKYPPLARAARVQGDVIVRFRQTQDGSTVDVTPISGPAMLQGVAV